MKFNTEVSIRNTDSGLAMLYNRAEGTLYELNETATAIVEMIVCDCNVTTEEIVNKLTNLYDVSVLEIKQDVNDTIEEFVEYGILMR